MTKNIALYVRSSIQRQDMENQMSFLHSFCSKKGYTNFKEYVDIGAGRAQYAKLLNDIRSKKINAIVCYSLDRLTRSIRGLRMLKKYLNQANVELMIVKQYI